MMRYQAVFTRWHSAIAMVRWIAYGLEYFREIPTTFARERVDIMKIISPIRTAITISITLLITNTYASAQSKGIYIEPRGGINWTTLDGNPSLREPLVGEGPNDVYNTG